MSLAFSELKLAAGKASSHLSLPPAAERSYLQACAVGNRVTSLPCLARQKDCPKAGSVRHRAVQENILNISFAFLLPFFLFFLFGKGRCIQFYVLLFENKRLRGLSLVSVALFDKVGFCS